MSKILLLGKNGMLGQAIEERIKNKESRMKNFLSLGRCDLDITDKPAVFFKIEQLKPAIVINATGYTNVDGAESERELAFMVNAEAVGNLAQVCARIGAALIHFSTDYIFDGTQAGGYREDDEAHIKPLNVYGESKLDGELRIKNQAFKYFIVRTSWLYGRGGRNFVDAMLARAKEGQKELKVVNDQFGKPTYTEDLAKRMMWMVEHSNILVPGIYHCTNTVTDQEAIAGISWYQFAKEIFEQAHSLGIIKEMPRLTPCNTAEFPRAAVRPRYSALTNTKLPPMRDWKEAIGDYIGQIIAMGKY